MVRAVELLTGDALFICGDRHVESFGGLLETNGIEHKAIERAIGVLPKKMDNGSNERWSTYGSTLRLWIIGNGMIGHRFLFDRDAAKAKELFPKRRCLSMADVGLPDKATDYDIVECACLGQYIIVTCNGDHFVREIHRFLSRTKKKDCHDMSGLVILPNGYEIQRRVVPTVEDKLRLSGHKIGWKDIWQNDCCVRVERNGDVTVTQFPRCRYCEKAGADSEVR